MNIKSLLLGSAAALAAVSGAQAADAIVAAEPEPMEYVRVCDAFGTGFFYIPGTETCLQIGGYVRFQVDGRSDSDTFGDAAYRSNTRGYLTFDAKSDSELGTIEGFVALESDSRGSAGNTFIDSAYIVVGGFQAGYFYNYWDTGINGETDNLAGDVFGGAADGSQLNDSIMYTYDGGAFSASAAIENFNTAAGYKDDGDDLGFSGTVSFKLGGAKLDLLGSYDNGFEEGAFRAIGTAEVGPGTLQLAGVYATGNSRYWSASEWSVAGSYSFKATDKLTLIPGAQYYNSIEVIDGDFEGGDAYKAGLTVDYKLTEGLTTKFSAQYLDGDDIDGQVQGFARLQRSF